MKDFMNKRLFLLLAISSVHQMTPMEKGDNAPAHTLNNGPSVTDAKALDKKQPRELNASFLKAITEDNDLEKAEQLLIEGANVHTKNEHGYTALFFAAAHGHAKTCALLIKHGAETNCGINKEPIWRVAVRHAGDIETIKFLLDDHILKQSKQGYSKSIITFLCCLKNKKKTTSDTLATTLYNQAATLLQPYCTFNLHGCTNGINQTNSYGMTALMDAADEINLEICEFLIARGAVVNIIRLGQNASIQTALSMTRKRQRYFRSRLNKDRSAASCLAKAENICELLLANGAIEDEED